MDSIIIDQIGRRIKVPNNPERIISLVPSQTELLYDLGLDDKIVGVTKFCVHPLNSVKKKTIVGGTKNFRLDVINQLRPDLIIGNKEENYWQGIDKLSESYPVWMSDINNLEDAYDMIITIGAFTDSLKKATSIAGDIRRSIAKNVDFQQLSMAYIIWKNPIIVAGTNTFINSIAIELNLNNLISESRYPEIETDQLRNLNPDAILLPSEPYPFKEEHIAEFKEICTKSKVVLVDGEMFSWYGSRLLLAGAYFRMLQNEILAHF